MLYYSNTHSSNNLMAAMASTDAAMLAPKMEKVELPTGAIIESPDRPLEYVYFLQSGLTSTLASIHGGREIEIGMTGREGFVGTCIALMDNRPLHTTIVDIGGTAQRVRAADFQEALQSSASLSSLFTRYIRWSQVQMASTALANGCFKMHERLARRLLMTNDRLDENSFKMTHETLASRLGVRRPGITVALHILEGKKLLKSDRAKVTILNREGLKAEADGCYGQPEAAYERLIGFRSSPVIPSNIVINHSGVAV